MDTSLTNRLEKITAERDKAKKLLRTMSPNENVPKEIKETHQIQFEANTLTKEVGVVDHPKGVSLYSELEASEHKYTYFVQKQSISELLKFFQKHNDEVFTLNFPGYTLDKCNAEFHLIFIRKDGKRDTQKLLLNEKKTFTLNKANEIDQIKIAIRVTGTGRTYIHHPSIEVVKRIEFGTPLSQKRKVKRIKDMNVIFIADEFTTRSFEPEFNAIKVTPGSWEEELKGKDVDLFFCESAWLGNNGSWTNKVGTGGPRNHETLLQIILWCRDKGIPTVFWNKEDPFHYYAFGETAKHFDYIFTTDANSIDEYKKNNCKNVFTLPFAAQPKYHNPIEKYERENKVVFAGAYYGDKFPERTRAMDNMIEVSGNHGIDIFDRNYNNPGSPNQFPEKFKKHIVGTLKGDQIERAYKGYKISLNVNSIIDSPTMFSRRVFEILASNTPVVSSESLGVRNVFGDLVLATSNFEELKERIDLFFNDEHYFKKNRLQGLRTVLEDHTYKVRIEEMLNHMNFPFIKEDLAVTAIGIVRNHKDYENIMTQFNRQTIKNKKLVILLDLFEGYLDIFNKENNENVKTYLLDYVHHYDTINQLVETEYFAPLHLDNYYGPNYLKDMALGTLYTEDTVIVKSEGKEYTYVTNGAIDRSLLPKTSTKLLTPKEFVTKLETKDRFDDWHLFGHRFFNIDNFNFITDNLEEPLSTLEKINI
ncbi:DUF3880 domain-containing protein (plasmid) [Rossellomorea sp. AcN35-11]|nr:DUF3880 domain-containing protein [Rossellomorea aquimaris]WJV32360.1 DUF3880 domain-containing protein [Rossellomorea sp. AcN35-11]